ncbi:MAG: TRL domain-containing protein [Elusimicrobiota bacterium]
MKRIPIIVVVLSAVLSSGCLYTNIHGPRAYRSATPSDVKASHSDARVSGTACYQAALWMFAWGDAGYAAAVGDALQDDPGAVLYDVQSDVKVKSVLFGIYSRMCTVVTGRVGRS